MDSYVDMTCHNVTGQLLLRRVGVWFKMVPLARTWPDASARVLGSLTLLYCSGTIASPRLLHCDFERHTLHSMKEF
jgi:hypothetical protein